MLIREWKKLLIKETSTLIDAMTVLDKLAKQIVLVVDEKDALLGTLTDGDIRRALIAGAQLNSSVNQAMNRNPVTGSAHSKEIAWRQIMRLKRCRHLPLLDENGVLAGIYSELGRPFQSKPNSVVLMLGGLGKRLRPLTEDTPKPMLKVGGKPILETIIERFSEQGFSKFHFCVNYLGHQIQEHFGDGSKWGIEISCIREEKELGTAGALSLIDSINAPFVVMNGDLLTKVDFASLIEFHQLENNDATMCVREYSHQVPYGVVTINEHKVNEMLEKPVYKYFVNGGIYVLSENALKEIEYNQYLDMPDLLSQLLEKDHKIGAFPITEYWKDIGQLPDFEQAQLDYEVHFTS